MRVPAPWVLLLGLGLLLSGCSTGQPRSQKDETSDPFPFRRQFAGREGTFVLGEGETGEIRIHNPARAAMRFLPASTFKIPNTLIALETGVVSGPEQRISRDTAIAPTQPWWPASWARKDHTLRTALSQSVVWYYQEVARRVGVERMQTFLDRFQYGNRNLAGGIDRFWLQGDLRISAEEQVAFLRRFYFGKLGLSSRTTETAKELLVLEETPSYRLSGKTGWAGFGETKSPQIGWLVGYLERESRVHFFALNLDLKESRDAGVRLALTKAILRDLALLPK